MKTYIVDPISDKALEYARKYLDVVCWDDSEINDYEKAEAVIVRTFKMTAAIIDQMPNLKIIAKHGVGVDNIDVFYASSKGIRVTNTPAANMNSVAELIIGLILDCAHKITASHFAAIKGLERNQPMFLSGHEIAGKKMGLIGIGRIGHVVGKRLKNGFDMEILAYDPFVTARQCTDMGFSKIECVDDICKNCDVISISVPLTDETRHMIGKRELAMMKSESILINASRGGIVEETALYDALQSRKIGGAAVDAFVQEPLPKDHPLLSCFNFVGTPHNGANTIDALIRMGMGAVNEVLRMERGELPLAEAKLASNTKNSNA